MTDRLEIRDSQPADLPLIEQLYPAAFPDENLLPLVQELLSDDSGVLSLVGMVEGALAGHAIFTPCAIAGESHMVALLGPLAIAPAWQQRGIGSALVGAGLERLEKGGTIRIYVLGDPAYYGRFGFEADYGVTAPYPLPEEWRYAWQSRRLGSGEQPLIGKLSVPPPWRQQALWSS
jgi:putative acetyltransferase